MVTIYIYMHLHMYVYIYIHIATSKVVAFCIDLMFGEKVSYHLVVSPLMITVFRLTPSQSNRAFYYGLNCHS